MAAEKLEKLTTDQLKKKEKDANRIIIASLMVFIICIIVLIILKPSWIGAAIPLLAPGIISVRERKKIKEELMKRESKV